MHNDEIRRLVSRRTGKVSPVLCALLLILPVCAQIPKPAAPEPEAPTDPLGRRTPQGTVLGFLNVARKGEDQLAAQYLNTRARGEAVSTLTRQLFVVLDRRLPARLWKLSDKPEGSMQNPLKPREELVGILTSSGGDVDILVERVDRGKSGPVWLFSRETLEFIPELYDEIDAVSVDRLLPLFLVRTRLVGIPLFEWLAFFVGIPVLYFSTVVLSRLLSPLVGRTIRRLAKKADLPNPEVLLIPTRLLVVALTIYAVIARVSLPLLARQFWSSVATVITIASCIWLTILWNGRWERYLRRRLESRSHIGLSSVLRLARRAVDLLAVFVGILIGLHYFGLNVTAALAGLGVGGVAVALAAQKTLENVIGGISIIVDNVVHVGDFLKVGDTLGTVEDIGLRSTRIRTQDRTVVSIPNGQIATVTLENFSRDKFWFHHVLRLRYDTTASQMCSVLEGLQRLLAQHPLIEPASVRVPFLRFGTSSLELELYAYFFARDYLHFLEIQTDLLRRLMAVVEAAGTQIALQTPVLSVSAPLFSIENEPAKHPLPINLNPRETLKRSNVEVHPGS